MIKTASLLALIVTGLASMPAHAQSLRVFVSGLGSDANPCTEAQPCRSFLQAYNTVAANGEINVLDPAGYGSLNITHGISIQGHGFGEITQPASGGAAITVSVTTSDPVTLNGLVLDGLGTGASGILINSGPAVQILNSVIRHFQFGINDFTSTNGAKLLIEDTIVSDNSNGIVVAARAGPAGPSTLNRITANNNGIGVITAGGNTTIANSVMSNNSISGLQNQGVALLAKTVISGNVTGVAIFGGRVFSYGDNYIRDNGTPVSRGSLTPVTTQ